MRCRRYSRKSTTSRTDAPFPPRSRRTTSKNSAKWRRFISQGKTLLFSRVILLSTAVDSSRSAAEWSAWTTVLVSNRMPWRERRSSVSTPKFLRIICISGLRMSSSKSSLLMCRSSCLSCTSRMSSKWCFKYPTAAWSFSRLFTLVATSQRMPISMFNMVRLLRNTKTMNMNVKIQEISNISNTTSATASRNAPCSSSTNIDSTTVGNSSRSGYDFDCILNTIPKR
mmetsp:Transcript_77846/g.241255  ORF Transcript_77846/g.241255 Transcript_77846/m.241255 type:complete len:226 (-) Transcript_77846:289-966(-)